MVFLCLAPAFSSAGSFPDRFDAQFERAADQFLPGVDYRLLKAQCYQESLLQADAVSPVGAQGLCQFMPATWREVSGELGWPAHATAFAPDLAIQAAAYYDAKLRRFWSSPRAHADRMSLVFASYNAGAGHLVKAQRLSGGARDYASISRRLPDVTGDHARETLTYVSRIWGYWQQMLLGA